MQVGTKQKAGLTNLFQFAAQNNLTGSLPEDMSVFTSLLVFDIFSNRVGGTIPAAISELTQLMSFDIEDNLFAGQAFVELSGLTDLASYRVSFNRLTGTIPAAVGSLTSLQELWVANNLLSGTIPETIETLLKLGTWDCMVACLGGIFGFLGPLTCAYLSLVHRISVYLQESVSRPAPFDNWFAGLDQTPGSRERILGSNS
jgi:hypothetical protein